MVHINVQDMENNYSYFLDKQSSLVHRITAICSYHIIQFVQTPVAILYGSYRIVTSVYFHYSNKLYHISEDLKETRAMVCCYYMYRIHS